MSEIHYNIDIGNIYEAVAAAGITIHNDVIFSTGATLSCDNVILTSATGLTSSGVNLVIDSGANDLALNSTNTVMTSTANTTVNAVDYSIVASGNKTETITGSNNVNSNAISLVSATTMVITGASANITATTTDVNVTSSLGSVSIVETTDQDGVNITTGAVTVTVNSGAVNMDDVTASNDIVTALNNLYNNVLTVTKQRIAYELTSIPIRGTTDAFGTFSTHPIYWSWINARYGAAGMDYQSGVLICYVVTEDVLFEIRNTVGDTLIQSGTFSVGYNTISYTSPVADQNWYMDLRSAAGTGVMNGLVLEFTAQNSPP